MAKNDYKKVRASIEKLMERDWGERCKTKDIEDFPELEHPITPEKDWGRCPVCLMYEKFDSFWEQFGRGEDEPDNV